jgi:hypothetical protein
MVHSNHSVEMTGPWGSPGTGIPVAEWRARQTIPGATIPPENSTTATGPRARNLYEIVLDISARTPQGGWTAGEKITYRVATRTYAAVLYIGYSITEPLSISPNICQQRFSSVRRAWASVNG